MSERRDIRLLPTPIRRIVGCDRDGKLLVEITAPGLVDVSVYPSLRPYTVPQPEEP